MIFEADEIIFLLGAGASADAKLLTSADMIKSLESCLNEQKGWQGYQGLYHCIKSGIFYGEGVNGKFGGDSDYNIERLVNTLLELQKKEGHVIYPFIASWNMKLIEETGGDFRKIRQFRKKIVERLLNHWVKLKVNSHASYYSGISRFREQRGSPLRVFTLNFDLCVEITCGGDVDIERGFGEDRIWDW